MVIDGGYCSSKGTITAASTSFSGQGVVMNNLWAHKGERIKGMIEGRGCQLLYLSAYSPDLNPIEEAFSKTYETRA
jgi:transposase